MTSNHDARVTAIVDDFEQANAALIVRLEAASDEAATHVPDDGGWTAAQVGSHVARVTSGFARIISGDSKAATPAPPDFVERPWSEVASAIPDKASAPERLHPADGVTRAAAIEELRASGSTLAGALRTLDSNRAAGFAFTYPMVGAISLYQVGEWAAGHVRRHTRQADRALAAGV